MVNVVAALINIDGKYFIGKRVSGEPAGLYEFPGGKVNHDESNEDALLREIREELSIKIDIIKCLGNVIYEYPTRTINLTLYLCDYVSGIINLHDHSDYKLVTINELDNYNLAPADKKLINLILRE